MSILSDMLSTLRTVMRIEDRVAALTSETRSQQAKLENLTERMIRVETILEVALAARKQLR